MSPIENNTDSICSYNYTM